MVKHKIKDKKFYIPSWWTSKKTGKEILSETEFLNSLIFTTNEELTDFLDEFLNFSSVTDVDIHKLYEHLLNLNPSDDFRVFLDDRICYIKLHVVNGKFVQPYKYKSVFPDKHKKLMDSKTTKTKVVKNKLKEKVKGKVKGGDEIKKIIKSKKNVKIADKFNKRGFKSVNFMSSKSSIYTVKKK
jgi:hypothetical protein